jgi:hypothetical protein
MTRPEVITKLKGKLSKEDKIEIFNWYLKNEAAEIVASFQQAPGVELRLSQQKISTVNTPNGLRLLEYSIIKIKEHLGIK